MPKEVRGPEIWLGRRWRRRRPAADRPAEIDAESAGSESWWRGGEEERHIRRRRPERIRTGATMLLLRTSARLACVTALVIASSLVTAKADGGEADESGGSGSGDANEPTPDDTPEYECKDMEEGCPAWSKSVVKDGQTMCEHNRLDPKVDTVKYTAGVNSHHPTPPTS